MPAYTWEQVDQQLRADGHEPGTPTYDKTRQDYETYVRTGMPPGPEGAGENDRAWASSRPLQAAVEGFKGSTLGLLAQKAGVLGPADPTFHPENFPEEVASGAGALPGSPFAIAGGLAGGPAGMGAGFATEAAARDYLLGKSLGEAAQDVLTEGAAGAVGGIGSRLAKVVGGGPTRQLLGKLVGEVGGMSAVQGGAQELREHGAKFTTLGAVQKAGHAGAVNLGLMGLLEGARAGYGAVRGKSGPHAQATNAPDQPGTGAGGTPPGPEGGLTPSTVVTVKLRLGDGSERVFTRPKADIDAMLTAGAQALTPIARADGGAPPAAAAAPGAGPTSAAPATGGAAARFPEPKAGTLEHTAWRLGEKMGWDEGLLKVFDLQLENQALKEPGTAPGINALRKQLGRYRAELAAETAAEGLLPPEPAPETAAEGLLPPEPAPETPPEGLLPPEPAPESSPAPEPPPPPPPPTPEQTFEAERLTQSPEEIAAARAQAAVSKAALQPEAGMGGEGLLAGVAERGDALARRLGLRGEAPAERQGEEPTIDDAGLSFEGEEPPAEWVARQRAAQPPRGQGPTSWEAPPEPAMSATARQARPDLPAPELTEPPAPELTEPPAPELTKPPAPEPPAEVPTAVTRKRTATAIAGRARRRAKAMAEPQPAELPEAIGGEERPADEAVPPPLPERPKTAPVAVPALPKSFEELATRTAAAATAVKPETSAEAAYLREATEGLLGKKHHKGQWAGLLAQAAQGDPAALELVTRKTRQLEAWPSLPADIREVIADPAVRPIAAVRADEIGISPKELVGLFPELDAFVAPDGRLVVTDAEMLPKDVVRQGIARRPEALDEALRFRGESQGGRSATKAPAEAPEDVLEARGEALAGEHPKTADKLFRLAATLKRGKAPKAIVAKETGGAARAIVEAARSPQAGAEAAGGASVQPGAGEASTATGGRSAATVAEAASGESAAARIAKRARKAKPAEKPPHPPDAAPAAPAGGGAAQAQETTTPAALAREAGKRFIGERAGKLYAVNEQGDVYSGKLVDGAVPEWKYLTTKEQWGQGWREKFFGDEAPAVAARERLAFTGDEGLTPGGLGALQRIFAEPKVKAPPAAERPEGWERVDDPAIERRFAPPPPPEKGWAQLKARWKALKDFKDQFTVFEPKLRDLGINELRNDRRLMLDTMNEQRLKAMEDLHKIVKGFDHPRGAAEFEAFRRLIALEDAYERTRRGLPGIEGRTAEEIQVLRDRLYGRSPESVRQAVEQHRRLLWQEALGDVARGLLPPEVLERGTYYPHHVLQTSETLARIMEHWPKSLREPYRAWTEKATGGPDVDYDYFKVMRAHLMRVRMAREIDDFAAKWGPRLDVVRTLTEPQRLALFGAREDGTPRGPMTGKPYTIDGKEYWLWRYRPHRWTDGQMPASTDQLAVENAWLRPLESGYLIPKEAFESFKLWEAPRAVHDMEALLEKNVTFWKQMQIILGGVPTQMVNAFGDTMQGFAEDLRAIRIAAGPDYWPTIHRLIVGTDPGQRWAPLTRILREQRVIGGSTYFGPQGTEAALKLLEGKLTGTEVKLPGKVMARLSQAANYREAWMRVAKAMADFERIQRGEAPLTKTVNVKDLPPEAVLGKIAREVFYDYGAASDLYKGPMGRGLMFPFITWFHRSFHYWNPLEVLGKYNPLKDPTGNRGYFQPKNIPEFMAKIGFALGAMWLWNNKVLGHQKTAKWTENYLFSLKTGFTNSDGEAITLVLPFGMDVPFGLFKLTQLRNNLGKYARGETDEKGILKDLLPWQGFVDYLDYVGQLSPLLSTVRSLASGRDVRTGKSIYSRPWVKGTSRGTKEQAWYLASQLFPIYGRAIQHLERAARRPSFQVAGPASLFVDAVLHGPLNPLGGFAFPQNQNRLRVTELLDTEHEGQEAADEARLRFEKAVESKSVDDLRDAMQMVAEAHIPASTVRGWLDTKKGGIGFLKRLKGMEIRTPEDFKTKLGRVMTQTPEERERDRRLVQALTLLEQLQALKRGSKSSKAALILDLIQTRRRQRAMEEAEDEADETNGTDETEEAEAK